MDFPNQQQFNMETLFDLDPEYPLICHPSTGDVQSSGFNVDNHCMSSTVFSSTQGRSMLPIKQEMEFEFDKICKRLKSVPTPQPSVYVSVLEDTSPLGLRLRKTPSFLDLVESKLSPSDASFSMLRKIKRTNTEANLSQSSVKRKASNFSTSILRIGSWERLSRYDGELVAKCYFAKRKLVWEVLDGGLKRKIEVQWSDIASLKATYVNSASETLEVELLERPLFFHETNPQPRKHTLWKATTDFTDGQASICRRHFLQFPQGTLQKHFEKALQLDDKLSLLSKKPYPSMESAFFGPDNIKNQNLNDHRLFGLEGQSSGTFKGSLTSESSGDSELLHCFTVTRRLIPQKYSDLPQAVTSSEILTHTLGYYNMEMNREVSTYLMGDLGETGNDKGSFNSNSNKDSTLDYEPSYWISDIQTNQNLFDSFEDVGCKSDTDRYLSMLSYAGELSEYAEDYANCEDDEAASSKVGEAFGWTSWV